MTAVARADPHIARSSIMHCSDVAHAAPYTAVPAGRLQLACLLVQRSALSSVSSPEALRPLIVDMCEISDEHRPQKLSPQATTKSLSKSTRLGQRD